MFKCTVCQKIHSYKVDYCDCGNDMFEEVAETVLPESPKFSVNLQQVVSGAVFVSCLALSGWIWFGIDSPKQKVSTVHSSQEINSEVKNIPSIDKIWDSSPAYTDRSPLALYKSEIQKALYSNLEEKEIIDEGRCEIEFKINQYGKVTNRRIFKEKGGSQFNNLVVKMIKKTDEVNRPPEGYGNTKFKAKVFTENGKMNVYVR